VDGVGPATPQTERMVYDGDNIALTFDGNGIQTHRYLYGPGVDQVLADETQTSVNWALVDNLGSIRDIIDSSGTVLDHIVYDSYGNITTQTNSSVEFRYGYTGREHDLETGLNYYRARYYDATTGEFLSEDPMGFAASDYNLSRYVLGSPTNWVDPTGLLVDPSGKFTREVVQAANKLKPIATKASKFLGPLGKIYDYLIDTTPLSDGTVEGRRKTRGRNGTTSSSPLPSPSPSSSPTQSPSPSPSTAPNPQPSNPSTCQTNNNTSPCSKKGAKIHYLGGSHSMVRNSNIGGEAHHMPSWNAIQNSGIRLGEQRPGFNGYNRAPAICMTIDDHIFSLSHGTQGNEGFRYRARQSILMMQGGFINAQQLDIQNIRNEFGSKYNTGITQVEEYTNRIMTQHPEWFQSR
jgi:RHS repeat-associated protein